MFDLPNKRPAFVVEDGGGGFSICDAVGARDWRIEYVRCMFAVVVVSKEDSVMLLQDFLLALVEKAKFDCY